MDLLGVFFNDDFQAPISSGTRGNARQHTSQKSPEGPHQRAMVCFVMECPAGTYQIGCGRDGVVVAGGGGRSSETLL